MDSKVVSMVLDDLNYECISMAGYVQLAFC